MDFMDVHAHLHDNRIKADLPKILTQATAVGVKWMVTCATMENNFEDTSRLARGYDCILPCFGIHPWFMDSLTPDWEQHLSAQLESIPSAVGETGLDFMARGGNRDLQLTVFDN